MNPMITVENVSKSFVLHNQGAAEISVMAGASLSVAQGECIALVGASGAGKSTLMRMIYGNYLTQSGRIMVGDLDVVTAAPRQVIGLCQPVPAGCATGIDAGRGGRAADGHRI